MSIQDTITLVPTGGAGTLDGGWTQVGGGLPTILADNDPTTYVEADHGEAPPQPPTQGSLSVTLTSSDYTSVTAFPGSPSVDQLVFRSDLGTFWVYDGTRNCWLPSRVADVCVVLQAYGSQGGEQLIATLWSSATAGNAPPAGGVLNASTDISGPPVGATTPDPNAPPVPAGRKGSAFNVLPGGIGAGMPAEQLAEGELLADDFYGAEWNPAIIDTLTGLELTAIQPQPVEDVVGTTMGSPVVTTVNASASNIGREISGAGIPAETYIGAAVNGVSYSLVDLTGAAVNATATSAADSILILGGLLRVYEAAVRLDLVVPVKVVELEVDLTAESPQHPTINWSLYDRNEDVPAAYQLRIFEGATADPDTDTPVEDSGIIWSSSLNGYYQLKSLLPDGHTYTAYIRIAKMFDGQLWWVDGVDDGTPGTAGGWYQMDQNQAGAATSWTLAAPTVPAVPDCAVTYDVIDWRCVLTINSSDSLGAGWPGGEAFVPERSVDGGVTWELIRGAHATYPGNALGVGNEPFWTCDGAGTITVYDWEPKIGQVHSYRARAYCWHAGVKVLSAESATVSVTPTVTQFFIRDPFHPDGWKYMPVADQPEETTKHPNAIDYVLGADLPIVVLGTPTGRDWSFTLNITDASEWDALRELINSGVVLLMYDPVQSVQYYVCQVADVVSTHFSRPITPWRQTPLQFVEVARPLDVG